MSDGGNAFPISSLSYMAPDTVEAGRKMVSGMSLRDYFAAKAMQAAATNPTGADGFTFEQRAAWAYQQADAMLAAREAK